MTIPSIAVAITKSFGDFVIAHSVLHTVEDNAKDRVRLIACGHLKRLNASLPNDVRVTFVNSGDEHVPALFDLKKRGAIAAVNSAFSLRRAFQEIERVHNEALAFHMLGVRERFIAGRWPVIAPRNRGANIYETYHQFLAEQQIRASPALLPIRAGNARSVGVFSESRLVEKRLTAPTLSLIFNRAAAAGIDAKLFILDGDPVPQLEVPRVANIPRNFESLADAICSVESVVSADSLPAHLAEYFARPVFVASSRPNEYWLPFGCFAAKHWGVFGNAAEFSASLDAFFAELRAA
jgi:hypothetical protein